ncbi:1995_t:CDS:2 [Cetraspora pellucida]|uniref:1995_t:CDS:1 n=1 Tax=Cetraspora pellucida TaxID=1433469 RepID=A0A9N9AF11_9GLOM|nr:1995_t:CDS:2 [Cetraspora pellucida]
MDAAREREEDTGCCLSDCLRISSQICNDGIKEQLEYEHTEEARRARARGFAFQRWMNSFCTGGRM